MLKGPKADAKRIGGALAGNLAAAEPNLPAEALAALDRFGPKPSLLDAAILPIR
jgi:hypothetical protein